ncbi:hypothetical protein [Paenibacillus terrae]|uniref:Uncharacterized protein n=1 Tax=Paenibacillus terrae TaxID=159743 RepID=A0A0D7WZT6_9BACL|nr:hypothetical protein [Paenibacillus terrae]KJD44721.1 hypothetical protein QD47_15225 [Paenibacillus terrae]
MDNTIVTAITKAKNRNSLFHFTRVCNVSVIAHFDAILSSYQINHHIAGERRVKAVQVDYEGYMIQEARRVFRPIIPTRKVWTCFYL